ncbi:MAG: hypothetical protein IPO83_06345 [Chitinophagaceae bacterium]|nr:hypothetical protein [Chitinophagaceae bacterium]
MKTITILSSLFLLLFANLVNAQDTKIATSKNKAVEVTVQHTSPTETGTLDRLQKETEDISVMKPVLFLAAIIDSRLALRRLERESIATAKSRESGSR